MKMPQNKRQVSPSMTGAQYSLNFSFSADDVKLKTHLSTRVMDSTRNYKEVFGKL